MKIVIQRVSESSVTIDGKVTGEISKGFLLLLGIEQQDTKDDIDWLTNKIVNLRIFDDEDGVMNLNINQVEGEILAISQFTLHASTKKGNRPSYIKAAKPATAVPLYEQFLISLGSVLYGKLTVGEFGADMKIKLINDGPVTIIIDSKNKE